MAPLILRFGIVFFFLISRYLIKTTAIVFQRHISQPNTLIKNLKGKIVLIELTFSRFEPIMKNFPILMIFNH